MPDPIPLHTAKRRNRAGQGGKPETPEAEEIPCPITALGHIDGKFWFLNIYGERRSLTARQLGSRAEIAGLFVGRTDWLKQKFKSVDDDGKPRGWNIAKAGEWLMDACGRMGLYGDHVIIRRPGVWPSGEIPIAHCGDAVFIDGEKRPPGEKIAGQIFAAAPRHPHPAAAPASAELARGYQREIETLWKFRDRGAALMAVGLVGQAYYAAAISWRANGFISGEGGSGKSKLLELLCALTPINHYTNDTSKAGIEGAVAGRAMPTFIDEASDQANPEAGRMLMDTVLSASSGAGTKGHRGTADGGVRSIELAGSFIMASVTPPAMLPQHRSRFVMIEMLAPEAGADHTVPMNALIGRAKLDGPALFARALAGFPRYKAALAEFRHALSKAGCIPREMDLLGAILAGQWLLTRDDAPMEDEAADRVRCVSAFVRGAEDMAQDGAPQLVLARLLTHVTNLHRSTDQESMVWLINQAMLSDSEMGARDTAVKVLARFGIKVVRRDEPDYVYGGIRKPAHRLGPGNGLWIDPRFTELRDIFKGSSFENDRWMFEIMRLKSATRAKHPIKVGDMPAGKPIWLSWDEINEVSEMG